jgi:hypothetical protein
LHREKFRGSDFGQFDTFSACIMIAGLRADVVDHQKIRRSAMNRLCIKERKSIWDGVLQQTWVWESLGTCSLHPTFCTTHRGWKMTYRDERWNVIMKLCSREVATLDLNIVQKTRRMKHEHHQTNTCFLVTLIIAIFLVTDIRITNSLFLSPKPTVVTRPTFRPRIPQFQPLEILVCHGSDFPSRSFDLPIFISALAFLDLIRSSISGPSF